MLGDANPLDEAAGMNLRLFVFLAKWIAGAIAYFVLCLTLSLTLVLTEMHLVYGGDDSAALGMVMFVQLIPIFLMCLFWGGIYASALARSRNSEDRKRTCKHWGLSLLLGLVSCFSLILMLDFRLPDFQSSLAVSAYIFSVFGFSVVCFVFGLIVRFRLKFRDKQRTPSLKGRDPKIAEIQS